MSSKLYISALGQCVPFCKKLVPHAVKGDDSIARQETPDMEAGFFQHASYIRLGPAAPEGCASRKKNGVPGRDKPPPGLCSQGVRISPSSASGRLGQPQYSAPGINPPRAGRPSNKIRSSPINTSAPSTTRISTGPHRPIANTVPSLASVSC